MKYSDFADEILGYDQNGAPTITVIYAPALAASLLGSPVTAQDLDLFSLLDI